MFEVKESKSREELNAILKLRYTILRQPWNQSPDTASDDLEDKSINAFICDEQNNVIACGRLQENENLPTGQAGKIGQIRFMAVDNKYQGKGLGKTIVDFLELKAKQLHLNSIELQARENAVKFYETCGYSIKEKSFLLWGQIQHYLMEKKL